MFEPVDEGLLVNYLLGRLSEMDQVQVEDRAFADPDYLGALEAAEADLIDSYIKGGLPPSERREFESRFLTSTSRWNKVEFARALAGVTAESAYLEQPVHRQQPTLFDLLRRWSLTFRLAAAFAALLCIFLTSWLVVQDRAMHSRIVALESQRRDLETREQALRRELSEQRGHAGLPATEGTPSMASLVLLPGLTRAAAGVEQLTLTPSMQIAHIEIQLEARDDYHRFRAELRTRQGEEILVRANLSRIRTKVGYALSFDVPVSALAVGEYELSLKGVTDGQPNVDVGYYYFGVRKR